MDVELSISNYRCFAEPKQITVRLQRGFVAILGPNNSGKSSILRFFIEFRDAFALAGSPGNIVSLLKGEHGLSVREVGDQNEVYCKDNDNDLFFTVTIPNHRIGFRFRLARRAGSIRMSLRRGDDFVDFRADDPLSIPNNPLSICQGDTTLAVIEALVDALNALANTMYVGSFRNIINAGASDDYYGVKVGDAFVKAWSQYKLGDYTKNNEAALRVTKDIGRIFGFREFEINPSHDNRTLKIVIDGKSFRLAELGAGLAHFILVLVNAAIKQPTFVLIDEPETGLHPSLQLDFLTTLGSYAKHGVVFATHSYGLARAVADRIYSIRRLPSGGSDLRDLERTPRLPEFLGELSYSGYQDLGFDQILLVEGMTDIKTAHQFLRWFGKDHQVVVLSLGGSDMINGSRELELLELKRITSKLQVLIDSERNAQDDRLEKSRTQFVEVCRKNDIACTVLYRRAIENYLSDAAIKAVKGPAFRALQPFEKLSAVDPHWGKEENWRIAREMKPEELRRTDLGDFFGKL